MPKIEYQNPEKLGVSHDEFFEVKLWLKEHDFKLFRDEKAPSQVLRMVNSRFKFESGKNMPIVLMKFLMQQECDFVGKRLRPVWKARKSLDPSDPCSKHPCLDNQTWDRIRYSIINHRDRLAGQGIKLAVRVVRLHCSVNEQILRSLSKRFHIWS